ncbi:ABC transporter ATP-binding protein [Streptomyces sp. NRRL WC-3618]|uniref:ABC transporter ATP-binding protein n=1 Tax=unclassified Streptomyces TaxID=2593676 RepID=UPI0006AF88E3|nr:ABC transporter ATP-binding protein [Streptomyces sp. NRRL WC-3618]KOV59814.1 ABC transporter ATP-binding protein [Streptomyces sp. NRRL WC-3618]
MNERTTVAAGAPTRTGTTARTGAGLQVEGLRYRLGDRVLLAGVDLAVGPGRSVAVTGPSGSGKSTLLTCVLGLIAPDEGTVAVNGHRLTGLSGRKLAQLRRRHLGVVFQFGELLPELTPVENVALPVLLDGGDHEAAYRRAVELLAELGVPHDGTPTGMLSGGERQRAAVARALITDPDVLLADEPTGALDPQAREAVADLLFEVTRDRGCALLVVTHDPSVAARADRTLRLESGLLRETGVGA